MGDHARLKVDDTFSCNVVVMNPAACVPDTFFVDDANMDDFALVVGKKCEIAWLPMAEFNRIAQSFLLWGISGQMNSACTENKLHVSTAIDAQNRFAAP